MADPDLPININLDDQGCYVPFVERDSRNRIIRAWGTIPYRPDMPRGTVVTPEIRAQWLAMMIDGDDIGHIIPRALNGSGSHGDNLFPQNARINRRHGINERSLRALQRTGQIALEFEFTFRYNNSNDSSNRPDEQESIFRWKEGEKNCELRFILGNPLPSVTAKMTKDAIKSAFMSIHRHLELFCVGLRELVLKIVENAFRGIVATVEFVLDHPFLCIGIGTAIFLAFGMPPTPAVILGKTVETACTIM